MAEQRDLTVDQGTNWNPSFILRNADKSPFNLTGYVARMKVRPTYDSDAVLDMSTTNGKLTITAAQGRIRINLLPADTSAIDFTGESLECVYDLEVQSSTGIVTRVAYGSFSIRREVTR